MRKTIAAVIGIIFAIVQAILPLTNDNISIKDRLFIAGLFALAWILYTIFSDKIEAIICRSIFGRNLKNRNLREKLNCFYNRIVPNVSVLQEANIKDDDNDFTKNLYYHLWCETIDFIAMDCCISEEQIDGAIVVFKNDRYAKPFRCRSIDISFLNSIIDVLILFSQKNNAVISQQIDFLTYDKRLKSIKKLIKQILS